MSVHAATVLWERGPARFTDQRYPRAHRWRFDGGAEVPASSSPHAVPVPLSDPSAVDPEEAFVAAIASCHMLWFLALAAKRGLVVDRYEDAAEGTLGPDAQGRQAITRVTLRPRVAYAGPAPTSEAEAALHEAAHASCFLAASVRSEIRIEPPPR
jgi:organic hydroperoxide reductase OsmC/OhrA